MRGLVRDKEEGEQVETPLQELLPEDSIIGPPYHKLFHQSCATASGASRATCKWI
ncbi:MAG: hypothetical protein R3F17_15950 [Planctomycetota bacterium]